MIRSRNYSFILVLLQFLCILFLLLLNESLFSNRLSLCISSLGFFVGLYALMVNKLSNFNITPEIKEKAKLITTGAYAYIRHPMYFAVLLIMLGVVTTHFNLTSGLIYLGLILILFLKAQKEEKLWSQKSTAYKKYMKTTKMFIPFIL